MENFSRGKWFRSGCLAFFCRVEQADDDDALARIHNNGVTSKFSKYEKTTNGKSSGRLGGYSEAFFLIAGGREEGRREENEEAKGAYT